MLVSDIPLCFCLRLLSSDVFGVGRECRSQEKVRIDIQGVLAESEAFLLSFHVCDGMFAFHSVMLLL